MSNHLGGKVAWYVYIRDIEFGAPLFLHNNIQERVCLHRTVTVRATQTQTRAMMSDAMPVKDSQRKSPACSKHTRITDKALLLESTCERP